MKSFIIALAAVLSLGLFTIAGPIGMVHADSIKDGICATDPTSAGCTTGGTSAKSSVEKLVKDIINIFSWVVGVVAVIMVIFGGFRYITSGGDSGKVTSAKNTIIYALVGLVIAALAQVIVLFVLGNVE